MSKIPVINMNATRLIGELNREYDKHTHNDIIHFLNTVKIFDVKNHKSPFIDWNNLKKIKIINNKEEHKKQQIYKQKINLD